MLSNLAPNICRHFFASLSEKRTCFRCSDFQFISFFSFFRLHVAKCGYSNGFVWHETGAPSSGGPSHIPGNGYRTDVFVHYVTVPGEDLFIYGNDVRVFLFG